MSNSNEIIQIDELLPKMTVLNATLQKTAAEYKALLNGIEKGNATAKEAAVDFDNLNKVQKQTIEQTKQKDALNKQLAASEEKLLKFDKEIYEQIQKNNKALADSKKAINDKIKAEGLAETSLVRMRQKLAELTAAYDKSGTRTKAAADEINKLSREIGKAETATNRHQRGVGGYADQLGRLSGNVGNLSPALGGATSAATTFGKALWALVANPIGAIIAAIVGSLALLYKAFTATDSGAVKMEGALKAIGNVMDLLIDRAMSYYKMLWSLVTFDWEGVKKNAKDAFGGIGSAIKNAVGAGMSFAEVMDDIADREAASKITIAKLSKEYTDLYLASKNVNLSYSERLKLADQAVAKETQVNELEVQFQKERTIANRDNLAALINNNDLSIESKRNLVDQWLLYDQKQLKSEEAKGGLFAEFVNLNEVAFQELQGMYAETVDKENELNQKTIRLQSQRFTFMKGMNDEVAAMNKEASDKKKQQQKEDEDAVDKDKENNDKILEDYRKLQAQKKVGDENAKKDSNQLETAKLQQHIDHNNAIAEADQKLLDHQLELEKENAEKLKELKEELAIETVNAVFEIGSAKRDEELSALDKEREDKLSNDKLTAAQKEKINAEFDKKAAVIKTKQAKSDKLQALFNIALSTAQASMKTLASVPLPAGAALLALTIALGAVQAGIVLAKPIPKFAKGTGSAPDRGIFGEAGRELMFLKSGDIAMANQATYFEGSKFKGAQIKSNPETERIMSMTGHNGFSGRTMTDERIIKGLNSVERAILNKPIAILDKKNRTIGYGNSKHQTIYLNRLMRNN